MVQITRHKAGYATLRAIVLALGKDAAIMARSYKEVYRSYVLEFPAVRRDYVEWWAEAVTFAKICKYPLSQSITHILIIAVPEGTVESYKELRKQPAPGPSRHHLDTPIDPPNPKSTPVPGAIPAIATGSPLSPEPAERPSYHALLTAAVNDGKASALDFAKKYDEACVLRANAFPANGAKNFGKEWIEWYAEATVWVHYCKFLFVMLVRF